MPYRIIAPFALAIALLSSCAPEQVATPKTTAPLASGVITQIGGHGNAYTSIRSSSYDSLGLKAGTPILLSLPDTSFSLLLGEGYTAVPSGEPVAVLHAESLTLAIRDGQFATRFSAGRRQTWCSTCPAVHTGQTGSIPGPGPSTKRIKK